MKHTLQEVRAEYDRLDMLCSVNTKSIQLRLSTRAKNRLGSFRFTAGKPLEIMLSAGIMDDDERFWDTIRHEYAHAITYLRYPHEKHGHDAVWKSACREVGCTPRATIKASPAQHATRTAAANYIIRCTVCGAETQYLRKGKMVTLMLSRQKSRLICRRCGSNRLILLVKQK